MPRNPDGSHGKRLKQTKRFMNIGIWNVKSMSGKVEDIEQELTKMNIDVAAISETKKKGTGIEEIGKYIHFYSGVPKEQRAKCGISLMISKRLKKYVTNWNQKNERIITLNLNYRGHRLTIIGVYAPNEDETAEIKDEYMENLNDTLSEVGTSREVILIGDMNARTGRRTKHTIVGQYGEETLNNNGERLINICEQYNLKITNGYYNHKEIHKYTWREIARDRKSIIDYLIVKQETKLKIFDVRAYRGPDVGSDHYLLKAKVSLPFVANTTNQLPENNNTTEISLQRYNIDSLQDESTKILYQTRLDQKLPEQIDDTSAQDLYDNLKTALHQAALEALGEKIQTSKRQNFWWNKELEQLKMERQKRYHRWLQTKQIPDQIEYKHARAKLKRKIIEQKNKRWEDKCHEIENYIGGRRATESWRFIKTLKSQTNNKKNIEIITKEKWKTYFEDLLTEKREKFQETTQDHRIRLEGEKVEIETQLLITVIHRLKNGRSTGPGGIPAELIKYGSNKLLNIIKILFEKCINGDEIPQEWRESWITPIHKKGARNQCNNYRGLAVNSTFNRLYGRILTELITNDYQLYQTEEQSGFRAGRSTMDNIFCLGQLIEKRQSVARETHLVFVDLTMAYDNIPISKLFTVLDQSPINITVINAVKALYQETHSRVKSGKFLTSQFKVTKGLRQGCCMSPILFNIYLDTALEKWRRKCGAMGLPIGDKTLFTLHYADDQVIVAQDFDDIEYMTRKLYEEYSHWGLTINLKKTEYMCIGGSAETLQMDDGKEIHSCKNYIYLGAKIDDTGRNEEMVNYRINKARKITGALNSVLWQQHISVKTKMHIYETMMKSTLMYGCEVWPMNKNIERRLLVAEMDFLRRSARKSRLDRVRNEEIRRIVNKERTVIEDIQRKQLIWYGHINRMPEERLPKQMMKWVPREKRKRGRPRTTWKQGVTKAMSERNLHEGDWQDRRYWQLGTGRRPHSL